MTNFLPLIRPTRVRLYLVLLQSMFLVLYGSHLITPLSRIQALLTLSLATLTLLVSTIPRLYVETAWFIGLVTLGNESALFLTFGSSTDLWLFGAVVLLVAMASYVPSILDFTVLSSLIIGEYGLVLYNARLLETDEVLALPLLLCLALVFVSKITTAQAEIQRIAKMEEQQRNRTQCDVLTGLPNRAQFLDQMARLVQYRHINRNFHFAVCFIDLDGFKPVNDKLGHKAGDAVLRHTAKLLQGCVRKGDVVARYGGDEFTVLLNHVKDSSDAIRVAQTILAKMQTPIDVGAVVRVGASIGIALSTNLHEVAEDLIRDADSAMYRAKAQGKNCYVISDQTDIPKAELKARWQRIARLNWLLRER